MAFLALAAAALTVGPAAAHPMNLYNQRHGCETLVTQAHPGVTGKARRAEIGKCKADPDAYNKAAGF